MPSGVNVYKPTVENGNAQGLRPDKASQMELLMNYLENPDGEKLFAVHAKAYAMSLLDAKKMNNSDAFADWNHLIEPIVDALALREDNFALNDTLFGKWIPRSVSAHLTILAGTAVSDIRNKGNNAVISVCALLHDEMESRTDKYEAEWNGFWQFFNVMQFLPDFTAVSATGLSQAVYYAIPATLQDISVSSHQGSLSDESWAEILEQLFDTSARQWAYKLIEMGISAPSAVGYELTDPSGAVVAECELAWEDQRIALLLDEQLDYIEIFKENGWSVILGEDEFTADIFQGGN
jgi:DEAD/DEAH box helicase domain-containing protein